jgi:peptidoglycan/LPS O-acetylase OafA/YrhL
VAIAAVWVQVPLRVQQQSLRNQGFFFITKLNNTINQLGGLQSLRGIAAWMVCVYHCAFLLNSHFPNNYEYLTWGQEGVSVFFVISGVVMPWSMYNGQYGYRNIFRFLAKRWVRLYPPFILSLVLFVAVIWLFLEGQSLDNQMMSRIWNSMTFSVPFIQDGKWVIDVYWTLFIEFQFYIYLAIMLPLMIHKNRIIRNLSFYLGLAIMPLSLLFEGIHVKETLFFHLPIFSLGFALFMFWKKLFTPMEFMVASIISVCFIYIAVDKLHGLGFHILIASLCAFSFIYFVKSGWKWLDFVGEVSYSFYLSHLMFVFIFYHKVYSPDMNVYVLISALVLLQGCAIFGAWGIYWLIEKPALEWTKKIKYVR